MQDGFIQIAFMVITVIANRRGLNDAAAVGIVEKIIGFLFLVPSSMLSAVSALGAQNIGAQKPERARKTLLYAIFIAAGFGGTVAVIMQFLSSGAVSLFTDSAVVYKAWRQSTCAAMRGIAFSPEYTLRSAGISVPAGNREFRLCTI